MPPTVDELTVLEGEPGIWWDLANIFDVFASLSRLTDTDFITNVGDGEISSLTSPKTMDPQLASRLGPNLDRRDDVLEEHWFDFDAPSLKDPDQFGESWYSRLRSVAKSGHRLPASATDRILNHPTQMMLLRAQENKGTK